MERIRKEEEEEEGFIRESGLVSAHCFCDSSPPVMGREIQEPDLISF